VIAMLADGFTTRRGRRGALLHHDAVNRVLRGRRGARLTALTAGGTIPDTADYQVLLEPENHAIGTVNEDFAVREHAGRCVSSSATRPTASCGSSAAPSGSRTRAAWRRRFRFWLGEAPGRSDELSQSVSRLRGADRGAPGR